MEIYIINRKLIWNGFDGYRVRISIGMIIDTYSKTIENIQKCECRSITINQSLNIHPLIYLIDSIVPIMRANEDFFNEIKKRSNKRKQDWSINISKTIKFYFNYHFNLFHRPPIHGIRQKSSHINFSSTDTVFKSSAYINILLYHFKKFLPFGL
jgi:hypothetical protein